MNMHNSWLDDPPITQEQARARLPGLEASNRASDPSQQVISLLQQLILEQQKTNGLLCAVHNIALMPSASDKSMLIVPTAQLTTEQLVQHIDPNFCLEKVGDEHHLYDKRHPKTNDLIWSFYLLDFVTMKPTYGELANAIQVLKNLRSQQK